MDRFSAPLIMVKRQWERRNQSYASWLAVLLLLPAVLFSIAAFREPRLKFGDIVYQPGTLHTISCLFFALVLLSAYLTMLNSPRILADSVAERLGEQSVAYLFFAPMTDLSVFAPSGISKATWKAITGGKEESNLAFRFWVISRVIGFGLTTGYLSLASQMTDWQYANSPSMLGAAPFLGTRAPLWAVRGLLLSSMIVLFGLIGGLAWWPTGIAAGAALGAFIYRSLVSELYALALTAAIYKVLTERWPWMTFPIAVKYS